MSTRSGARVAALGPALPAAPLISLAVAATASAHPSSQHRSAQAAQSDAPFAAEPPLTPTRFACNTELVGSYAKPNTIGTVGGFKVERCGAPIRAGARSRAGAYGLRHYMEGGRVAAVRLKARRTRAGARGGLPRRICR